MKEAIVKSTDKVYVLTDDTKFHQRSTYKCCTLNDVDGIITNAYPGRDVEKMLEKKEVNLIIAG